MDNCLFCKFANKTLEKEFVYEDEDMMVFPDIHPVKPIHLLIVPKKHYEDLMDVSDKNLLAKMFETIEKMVKEKGLDKNGYRVLINGGGAQAIRHLHIHLFGPIDQATLL
jgi:histidine triad (HIT) family protein